MLLKMRVGTDATYSSSSSGGKQEEKPETGNKTNTREESEQKGSEALSTIITVVQAYA